MAAIELTNVTKTFGDTHALDKFSMRVREGTVHGFLGPNGAGKTTALRALLGLYRIDEGTIILDGEEVVPGARYRQAAYVPGDVALWPKLRGDETLAMLASLRGMRDEAREKYYIDMFDVDTKKKVGKLSKGNRQKIALVAALAAPTPILILDEPSSGLDPLMEHVFTEAIRDQRDEGRTVLLSSHILSEVETACDDVTLISSGKAVTSAPLSELLATAGLVLTVRDDQVEAIAAALAPTGVEVTVSDGQLRALIGRDSLADILPVLAARGATDVTITRQSLEELFLSHYEVSRG
ncbi:MAG: ABC transporter ATP-binding protein [Flaviflexus sp.]|nr:ABC transporter ATP-binding protein [Flaviflexus sp.]